MGLTVFDVIHFLVQRNGYSYHVYPFFWLESVAGGGGASGTSQRRQR
jgi:hypothetical protein